MVSKQYYPAVMKYTLILLLGLLVFIPNLTWAQVQESNNLPKYDAGVDKTIGEYLCTPSGDGKDVERCINRLYRFGITAGAIVLVVMLVIAGYIYLSSGESGKSSAKNLVVNSIVGIGILLSAYVLLGFINPNLLIFKPFQPPIFEAPKFPDCKDVGLGEQCLTSDGKSAVGNGAGGGTIEGGGQVTGKKFVIMGDSLTPKFIPTLNKNIIAEKGSLVAYSIGGTTVSDWAKGGVKKDCGLYNKHEVQKQIPCSPTTKLSDIVSKEKPDIVIIVLNTNRDNDYKSSIPSLVSQANGKSVYWIGTPQYESCTKLSDDYIKDANAAAAAAVGKNFFDTYAKLPGLNKGCDVHNQDPKVWSEAFWKFYKG